MNPQFADIANADFEPTVSSVNNIGTPVGVTEDIFGMPRSLLLPDAGAIEFDVPGLDAGITLVSPQLPVTYGNLPVTVELVNTQTILVDDVKLFYTDGIISETQTFANLSLATGNSVNLTFTVPYNFTAPATLTVFIDEVNGVTDEDQANDTVRIALCESLAGAFTIDSSQVISLTNYHSFQALADDMANCGINGVVTVTVASGTYVEQVVFREVPGASLVNTITFESASGDSSLTTLSWSATSTDINNYTVMMDGADFFTFKNFGLARIGTNETFSRIVSIQNGCDNNTFTNCLFSGPTGNTSTLTTINRTSVTFLSSKNDNNKYTNNYFVGNGNAFWGEFTAGAPKSIGTEIINNRMAVFYAGVFITNEIAPVIYKNYVTRTNPAATTVFFGISLNFVDSTVTIEKNQVYCYNGGSNAIRFRNTICNPLTPGRVVNNFGQTGGTGTSQGISYELDCANILTAHNNILTTGTSATLGRSLNISGNNSQNLIFLNNNFVNTGGGYTYYITSGATGGVSVSDYNNLYTTGSNIGFWGTANTTLAAFRTASGKEANSVSGDPEYVTIDDLHVNGIILSGAATPLAEVTDDIDGDLRDPLTPDIGADEFEPAAIDVAPVAVISPVNNACGDVNTNVEVSITNFGALDAEDIDVTVIINQGTDSDTLSTLFAGPLGSLQTATITLGTINTFAGGNYDFIIIVNVLDDNDNSNDTLMVSVRVPVTPDVPSLVNDTEIACLGGTVSFAVDNPVATFYNWYDEPVGGNLVGSGVSFVTPAVTENDTFYVEASNTLIEFVPSPTPGTGGFITQTVGWGLEFVVNTDVQIDSVTVYPTGSGTMTISILTRPGGAVVYTAPVSNISGPGPNRVYVGAILPPGDYMIGMSSTGITSLIRELSGNSFPYSAPSGSLVVTGGSTSTATNNSGAYYWFYNWQISIPGCVSVNRTPVYALVDSSQTLTDAAFSFSANELTVDFEITNPGSSPTVTWDFGDSNNGVGVITQHTFASDGAYSVCATAENSCNTDTDCRTVVVCADLVADFTYIYNINTQRVEFTYSGTGNPTQTIWDFGDAGSSIQTNPTYQYASESNYSVTLFTTNLCGAQSSVTKTVSACAPIDVVLTATEGNSALEADVVATTITGAPTSLVFQTGDGGVYNTATFSHTYQTEGNYDITLIATNACGQHDTTVITYSACEALAAGFTVADNALTVTLTPDITSGTPVSYDWDFGDNNSSADENPVHTYAAEGTYDISLTVTNACGETEASTQTVNIIGVSVADVIADNSVRAYPNPNNGKFSIERVISINAETSITIHNVLGQEVFSRNFKVVPGRNTFSIDLKETAAGIYQITIEDEAGTSQIRIVKE